MKRRAAGFLNGSIAAASYGMNPLFALPMYNGGIGVNSVLFYRYFFAVLIYGLWIKFVKKDSLKISLKEFIPLFILGIFFSLSSLTLFMAFEHIAAGIACTILFIYPIMVAVLMAVFFKEKITKAMIVAICLTTSGIILLYKGKRGDDLNIQGVLIVLTSALLYALYIIGVKNIKTVKHMKSDKLSFYVMLFGLLVYVVNLKFCTELQVIEDPFLWLCALGLALLPTIISIETITVAIKLIGSTTTAILGALEPLTAIFFGVLLFNEQLTPRICLGVFMILSGVMLIVTRKMQRVQKYKV